MNPNNIYQINGAKFRPIISTVKFHTQLEEKTIVPKKTQVHMYIFQIYIYVNRIKDLITKS